MIRVCLAEAFGTFAMVFAGTGAVVVNGVHPGSIGHAGIALTFGLIVTAMIYGLGERSGAHMNPAVTVGFAVAGRFPWSRVPAYVLAQSLGAVAASLALVALFPGLASYGGTLPADTARQAWVFEFLLSLILMVVILGVSTGAKEKGLLAGVAVGATIALEAMFAGPVCGASMNPARSLAPALAAGHFEHLWIYLTAPIAGTIGGVSVWRCLDEPKAKLDGEAS